MNITRILPRLARQNQTIFQTTVRLSSSTPGPGSDDDFRPTSKVPPSTKSAREIIEADLRSSSVFLYMKGTPDRPMCGFSQRVVLILKANGVPFSARNVLENDDIRQAIKEYSDWPTIPQLYVKEEFVGGADIVAAMHESGELQEMVKKHNIVDSKENKESS